MVSNTNPIMAGVQTTAWFRLFLESINEKTVDGMVIHHFFAPFLVIRFEFFTSKNNVWESEGDIESNRISFQSPSKRGTCHSDRFFWHHDEKQTMTVGCI